MDPTLWLRRANEELEELSSAEVSAPDDAWRALTLIARLLGSPSGPTPPATMVAQLDALLGMSSEPDPAGVLDMVLDGLESGSDPWGPLLDALLDVDDTLGVLRIWGADTDADELARRVAALVSLHPERTIALGSFAQMRLATVRSDSAAAVLWRSVLAAPGQLLAAALRVEPASSRQLQSRQPAREAARFRLALPREAHLAAAATQRADGEGPHSFKLSTSDERIRAWLYEEEGRLRLEVSGLPDETKTVRLVALAADGTRELAETDVSLERDGSNAYADLGPSVGEGNSLHALVKASGLAADSVDVVLEVDVG